MTPAFRGRLITASFARDVLPTLPGITAAPATFHRAVVVWSERLEAALGPAASVRAITDVAVTPLLRLLGYAIAKRHDSAERCVLQATGTNGAGATVVVLGWNELIGRAWRANVLESISADGRWCFCCNGRELRIVDSRRTWAREYLEFDLPRLASDQDVRGLLWTLIGASALEGSDPLLDRAVTLSAQHGVEVCRALGKGVLDGLQLLFEALTTSRRARHPSELVFEHSLTVLYRVLFLLFAEARGLVPIWHPIYRDRYSLDVIVTTLLRGRQYRGLWQAVNAISRLANSGCSAGDFRVTAFNGRLFAPSQAAAFEGTRIGDAVMSRAIASVSTAPFGRHRQPVRIVYRDLDVEQLGAVYERVLDYEPASAPASPQLRRGDARKSTGTFYTPKAVTAHLVRRTLEPLIRNRSADEILELRVVDPAMGSGAFLVAACRYLASVAEESLIREGRWHAGDVTPADRVALRRAIASRCLFGVDLNPMAVQLARLSLWLATLAADKPLSFLDHHLVSGDSLIGASPDDLKRQPTKTSDSRRSRAVPSPLFEAGGLSGVLEHAVRIRSKLTHEADASASVVRAKEQALAALGAPDTSLDRWSRVLDLWCAGWFWNEHRLLNRATFQELTDHILRGHSALPERVAQPLLKHAATIAEGRRFLHWTLTFPEVFTDPKGEPLANPGFDAVLGNPPWDMVRGDSGSGAARDERRRDARQVVDFVREAGIYRIESQAHLNRYQLFLERALQLVKSGGRIGLVLPSGAMTDSGTASLRRHLFDRASVDSLVGLDNRNCIFPVHRSLRFVLLSCTSGRPTTEVACRFGVSRVEDLEPDASAKRTPMTLTRRFLARLSGEDDLGIPELASEHDCRIVERISAGLPCLGSKRGWNVRFGRELNASDDRHAFVPRTDEPRARRVVEGKQLEPFRVALEACRFQVADAEVQTRVPRRARLAYRDVASATNRLTLIAAIVPPEAVTTHTLFCLKNSRPVTEQRVLCAMLNSFVANYLIRLRVNTHVTVALVSRLPVPVVRVGHPLFARLASLSEALMSATEPVESMAEYAELQALAARLYGLTEADLEHVLSTFPLISPDTKAATLSRFRDNH